VAEKKNFIVEIRSDYISVHCDADGKLLFENAKDILPYMGIGSGIMRAMQNYDKIVFKNDFVREEFITTIVRDEIPEDMIIHVGNEGVNFGVNETQKQILKLISENPQNYRRKWRIN
jgi:hypothetical protein